MGDRRWCRYTRCRAHRRALAGLRRWARLSEREGSLGAGRLMLILAMLMAGAWFTDMIGVHAVFGAFVLGVAMPRGIVTKELSRQIEPLATALARPALLCVLRAQHALQPAVVGRTACCWRWWSSSLHRSERLSPAGEPRVLPDVRIREALAMGALMNARGLMELIILNIGLERGLITPTLFTVMVMMTIATTMAAGPLFDWAWKADRRRCRMPPASPSADRLSRLIRDIYGRNPFYTRKLDAAGIRPDAASVSVGSVEDCRSRRSRSLSPISRPRRRGEPTSRSRSIATRATTRRLRRPAVRCDGSIRTRAGNGCSSAGRRSTARRRVDARDRILFPFSFGPFLGFWTAFEAGCQLGAHCIPAGGMSSQARLSLIDALKPTVICCTPTYALRLMEVAADWTGDRVAISRRARSAC